MHEEANTRILSHELICCSR